MRSAIGWASSICLLALPLRRLQPAAAEPAAAGVEPPAEAAAPQHGGGFALLLLDYRMALERLTQDPRARTAELAEGAAIAPAEMTGALQRVTAGTDPVRQQERASDSTASRVGLVGSGRSSS